MCYQIKHNGNFKIGISENKMNDKLTILHISADKTGDKEKLNFKVRWEIPDIGIHTTWTPGKYDNKEIVPDWGPYESSCAMSLAPVYANLDYNDMNKQTFACSDGKNTVEMHAGLIEEKADLECIVNIKVDYPVSHYEVDIRIDRREIAFDKVIDDVRAWWEGYEGYTPAEVPEAAYMPVYSTWYSFHQDIDTEGIVNQCRHFSKLGCKTVIVDDGWQTDNMLRGYAYCGDWRPVNSKVESMKTFVDAIHETGMKCMLWYSVPYVGAYTKAYEKFKDKMLYRQSPDEAMTYIVDPRYPEIREYLIGMYKQAVIEWGLDGFKLDFIDSFKQSEIVKEGMDYVSVYDAVDRLLKDVIKTLKEIKPDILIEFRQSYMGPLMRTFGNMFRALDCPNDSWTNQMRVLALRLTSGNTAVHSDMVMWNYNESAELAAFQLTRVLFSVPQISIKMELMGERQQKMVERYLELWNTYRETIMFGEMLYKGYSSNFPYVSARSEKNQVGAVYGGETAYIEVSTDEIVLVNSTLNNQVIIQSGNLGDYEYKVYDCCGKLMAADSIILDHIAVIDNIPVNGTIVLKKERQTL